MGVLERILATKRDEVATLKAGPRPAPAPQAHGRSALERLRRPPGEPLRLLAEIKFRSPSAGPLSTHLGVVERAGAYAAAGATAISVLCDGAFFDGAYEHLRLARAGCRVPLLCKEFIIDEVQLDQARAHGADLALLIVRCIEPARLGALVAAARERNLEPLVEVTHDEEARRAVDAGASLIGVNARDLDTLEMDVSRARRVLAELPDAIVRVHLSGLREAADVTPVASGPADAALIGEALMRDDDPAPRLARMVAAAAAG